MWKKNSNRRDAQGRNWVNRGRSRFTHTERRDRSFQRKDWPEEKQDVHLDNADFGRDSRRVDVAYINERNEPLDRDRRADNYNNDRNRFYEGDNQTFRETSGPGYKDDTQYAEEGYNQRYSSVTARYSNVDDREESYHIDDGRNTDRNRRNIDTLDMEQRYPDQQYHDDFGQNTLDINRRDQLDFDKRDHTDYRSGEMIGRHEDYPRQEDYHRERRLSQENLQDTYNVTQRHDDLVRARGDDKDSYSRESRRIWKDHKPESKLHIATKDKIKGNDDRRKIDNKKSSISSGKTYPKRKHPVKKSATKPKLPQDFGVDSKRGHSQQSHHSKSKTDSGKHSHSKEKESARALHNENSGSIGKVSKTDHRSKDTSSTKKIKRDDDKKNEKINPKSSTKNIPQTETGGFKTPQSKFSQPRFRSNSGRKYEHDVGHFHDDDIISIMADDDEFLGDHSQNPSRFGSSASLNRLNLDERAFGSSRNRTTNRQDTSPSFDKDSQRRPRSQFETDSYSSRGMQAGPSSSFFKDHDLNEVNIDIKSPPRGQIFENKDITLSGKTRDQKDYKSHPRQNVSRFHGQNTKNSKMVSNSNSKVRVFSSRFSKAGFKKSRFSGFGKGSNVFQRNQNRVARKEIGKTGAILKDDRDIVNMNDDNTGRMSIRKNTFNKSYQGNFKDNRADLHENYRRKDYRVSFKSRRLAYHERVKQKYFKGGFSKRGSDRRGGKYTRESHGRYSASDLDKRRDHLYEETGNRTEHLYELEDNSTRNIDRSDHSPGRDTNNFSNDPGQGDQGPLEEQQQIIYIANPNISANQTQMVDQFGHIIFSSDFGGSDNIEQVPVQYIQQAYNPDGTPTGEQVVFIPFINSQGSQGFAENLPLPYGENQVEGQSLDRKEDTVSAKGRRNRSVLSKEARARLRRSLELKRKKRLEAEIEKRLLKKLLQNRNTSAAPKEAEMTQTKKKPVIKRISPPSATKPTHADKKFKLVHRGNKKNDLEDVSSDNENVYDNVSDLEDVTDSDDMDQQQEKRPGFRKPGQSRMGRHKSAEFQRKETGDVRRVVDSSTRVKKGGEIRSSAKTMENEGEVYRRSVFLDDAPGTMHKSKDQAMGQKRSAVRYEHQASKKQRSVSPIEITVRNDRYTKDVSKRTLPSTTESKYERNKGKIDSYKHEQERDRSGSRYEESHDRYLTGNHKSKDGGYNDHKRQHSDVKSSELPRKSVERTEIHKEKEKHYKGDDRKHSSSHSRDVDIKEPGKYKEDKNYKGSNRIESSRKGSFTMYASDQKESKRTEKDGDHDDRGKEQKHDRESSKSADKRDKRDRSRSRDRGYGWERSRSKEKRNDSVRSRSKERNRKEDDEYERNRGRRNERSGEERKRSRSSDRHKRHLNETAGGYTDNTGKHENAHMMPSITQNQLPMNPVFFQQSMKQPPYMVSQSQSLPLHSQPLAQFQNTSSVDHSLPPVQIAPMQMPPMPPPGLGINQDMSLPPAMMQLGNSGNMVLHQQPNSFQFQHQVNMQQQQMQQQFQMQQQQQQQFHQMQRQQQVMQSNTPQFQPQQSVNHTNMNAVQNNQHQRVQHVPPNQFQSNYSLMPSNQNIIQNQMNTQTGSMNSGLVQGSTQMVPASTQQGAFIATTPQQALRGVYGTIKHTGSSSQPLIRGSQPLQGTSPANKGQVGTSKLTKKPVHYGSNQSGSGPRNKDDHYTQDDDDNDDDDDNLVEMLCTKCDKVFLSFELMRRHGKWHEMKESNNKTFRCDQCEQGFSTSSMYTNHQSKKHSRDSWNCSLCDMSFSNSSSLNRHVRKSSHKDLKVKFLCSLCPASYMVLSQLIVHKKENHQGGTGYTALRNY